MKSILRLLILLPQKLYAQFSMKNNQDINEHQRQLSKNGGKFEKNVAIIVCVCVCFFICVRVCMVVHSCSRLVL